MDLFPFVLSVAAERRSRSTLPCLCFFLNLIPLPSRGRDSAEPVLSAVEGLHPGYLACTRPEILGGANLVCVLSPPSMGRPQGSPLQERTRAIATR